MGGVKEIAMFMLYLVLVYLLVANAKGFNDILNTVGANWRSTLTVLQARTT